VVSSLTGDGGFRQPGNISVKSFSQSGSRPQTTDNQYDNPFEIERSYEGY
jgi:hypothetical protein